MVQLPYSWPVVFFYQQLYHRYSLLTNTTILRERTYLERV